MSPRRRIQPGEEPLLKVPKPTLWSRLPWRPRLSSPSWKLSRTWALPAAVGGATVLTVGAIAASSLVLVDQRSHHRQIMQDVEVLGYVKAFMAEFTTLDPFHANTYVDRILGDATGDFAKQVHAKRNEILIQVAQAEPTKGTALTAGVERWNDDGSASVMVATDISMKSPDGKQKVENTNRWVVVAQREGKQWRISSLQQVI